MERTLQHCWQQFLWLIYLKHLNICNIEDDIGSCSLNLILNSKKKGRNFDLSPVTWRKCRFITWIQSNEMPINTPADDMATATTAVPRPKVKLIVKHHGSVYTRMTAQQLVELSLPVHSGDLIFSIAMILLLHPQWK